MRQSKLEPWERDLVERIRRGERLVFLMPRRSGMRRLLERIAAELDS